MTHKPAKIMRDTTGVISGTVATVTLSNVNLLVGIAAGLLTIICLLPNGVKNWRELACNYAKFKNSVVPNTSCKFLRYALGLPVKFKETAKPKDSDPSGDNI